MLWPQLAPAKYIDTWIKFIIIIIIIIIAIAETYSSAIRIVVIDGFHIISAIAGRWMKIVRSSHLQQSSNSTWRVWIVDFCFFLFMDVLQRRRRQEIQRSTHRARSLRRRNKSELVLCCQQRNVSWYFPSCYDRWDRGRMKVHITSFNALEPCTIKQLWCHIRLLLVKMPQ